ncbi:MAG: hypothetical protein KJ077_08060 [Anaerolineae bacterium]|nr:hypothetical protein [Anaerolineae bacterium]
MSPPLLQPPQYQQPAKDAPVEFDLVVTSTANPVSPENLVCHCSDNNAYTG